MVDETIALRRRMVDLKVNKRKKRPLELEVQTHSLHSHGMGKKGTHI